MSKKKAKHKSQQKVPLTTRERRWVLPAVGLVVAAFVLLIGSLSAMALVGGSGDDEKRAGIVDQLSLTAPNPQFGEDARRILEERGYEVDYFPGEQVDVDLYRSLPERDYDILLLRTHSTAEVERGDESVQSVSLFTNEPYSRDLYYEEQLAGLLGFAYYEDDGPQFFGITADFIKNSMKGDFGDTIVFGMGCQGLINELAAQAFAEKGARTFIGWDGLVSADHTDRATLDLLQRMLANDAEPAEAVAMTMAQVGPDPDYGSVLVARP
jgi:hypothetical protein